MDNQLLANREITIKPSDHNPDYRDYWVRFIPIQPKVLEQHLMAIPGVMGAWVNRYRVSLDKASNFDWVEIEPKVLDILTGWKGRAQE